MQKAVRNSDVAFAAHVAEAHQARLAEHEAHAAEIEAENEEGLRRHKEHVAAIRQMHQAEVERWDAKHAELEAARNGESGKLRQMFASMLSNFKTVSPRPEPPEEPEPPTLVEPPHAPEPPHPTEAPVLEVRQLDRDEIVETPWGPARGHAGCWKVPQGNLHVIVAPEDFERDYTLL